LAFHLGFNPARGSLWLPCHDFAPVEDPTMVRSGDRSSDASNLTQMLKLCRMYLVVIDA